MDQVVRCRLSVFGCRLSVARCPLPVARCPLSVVRCPLSVFQGSSPWSDGAPAVPNNLTSVSLPYLLSEFFTGGNRGNGELKTWSDGAGGWLSVFGRLSVFGFIRLRDDCIGFLHKATAPPPSQTTSPPFPPLPPVRILQEGTEVTENSKHGATAPPPSQTLLPSVSLPYLLSDFLQEGTEVTKELKHGATAPPPSQTTSPPFPPLPPVGIFYRRERR